MVQLIARGEYTMVTHKMAYQSNWYYSELANSNVTHFKQLREALKENPIIIKDTLNEALELVQEGSYIYASQQDSSTIQLLTNSCGLYYYSEGKLRCVVCNLVSYKC
uniref:Uncharacterized protein n=1 Tax=Acrobeloides nanus TaxID=290746 RepID=A0A914CEE3_9BILA